MTSPRIFPCSSTIDFSFRIVPLSSPRTSTRLFQVSEDGESSTEIRTRRSSRGAREAGTGLKVPGNRMPQLRSDPPPRLPISGQVSPSSTPLGCALHPRARGFAGDLYETLHFERPFRECGGERARSSRVGTDNDSQTEASLVPSAYNPDRTACCRRRHNGVCRSPIGCFRLLVSPRPLRVSARNCPRAGEALDSPVDVERPVRRNRKWDGPRIGHDLLVYHRTQWKRRGVVRPP